MLIRICTGCGIGISVSVARLEALAKEHGADTVICSPALCTETVAAADSKIVIVACSERARREQFRFDPERTSIVRVDLREQCTWSHGPSPETQALAEDLLLMGIARASKAELPRRLGEPVEDAVLIVGGGRAGLEAALAVTSLGHPVLIVEKESKLGGYLAGVRDLVPERAPYDRLQDNHIAELIDAVAGQHDIEVHLSTVISKVTGQPGQFDVKIANGASRRAGAIVQTTGARPYEVAACQEFGYGKLLNVVTSTDLEAMILRNSLVRPSDGKRPESIAFVQCVGSLDARYLPYCSAECCETTLKQIAAIHRHFGSIPCAVIYRHMRVQGQLERFYAAVQELPGCMTTCGVVSSVKATHGRVRLAVSATPLGDDVVLHADLVVLAIGMIADAPAPSFICFPYETGRTGVYAAGTARAPMNPARAAEDGRGAALKAIQSIIASRRGAAVHPRSGDVSLAEFSLRRCTRCKRCVEECPFGALDVDDTGLPQYKALQCRRCGICVGCCPEHAVSFPDYSTDQISNMIKAARIPPEESPEMRVLAFVCENDALAAIDEAARRRLSWNPWARIIPVRCLGAVNNVWIADALTRGYDGVLLLGCKNDQCHYLRGSELARKRLGNLKETIDRLALDSSRVQITDVAHDDWARMPAILDDFAAVLTPNPMRSL